MTYILACVAVFVAAYTLNLLYTSVFYHRGITHSAIKLHPKLLKFVLWSGPWVTGLDAKGWCCMHRMHHQFSDTEKDPHTPTTHGIFAVLPQQVASYKRTLAGLVMGRKSYSAVVSDLDFPVSWSNRNGLWYLPYILQLGISIAIGFYFDAWMLAICYYVGIMSHPIQGWMVNALAHQYGYRNFETKDQSKNNTAVAWLVFGEGFQNNHHHAPSSADFSVKPWEVDFGYWLVRGLKALRLVTVN